MTVGLYVGVVVGTNTGILDGIRVETLLGTIEGLKVGAMTWVPALVDEGFKVKLVDGITDETVLLGSVLTEGTLVGAFDDTTDGAADGFTDTLGDGSEFTDGTLVGTFDITTDGAIDKLGLLVGPLAGLT